MSLWTYLTLEHKSGIPPPLPEGDVHGVVHVDHVQGSEGPHKQWTLHLMTCKMLMSWEIKATWVAPPSENLSPPSEVGRWRELYWVSFRKLSTILCSAFTFLIMIFSLDVKSSLKPDLFALADEMCWQVSRVKISFRARIVMRFCQTGWVWVSNDLWIMI